MEHVEYTFRIAVEDDVTNLIVFHNKHSQGNLYHRTEEDLLIPIKNKDFYLVERVDTKEIFGIGAVFKTAPHYFMHGAHIDLMRNNTPHKLQNLFYDIGTLSILCRSNAYQVSLVGVFYGEIYTANPFLSSFMYSSAKSGFHRVLPDSTMKRLSDDFEAGVFIATNDAEVPLMAKRVLSRGSVVTATSRRYNEQQIISIDVPVVRNTQYLQAMASVNETLQVS